VRLDHWTLALLLTGLLMAPSGAQVWGPDEVTKEVAPYALYPDTVLARVLAASTFPDQVVAASAWCAQNPGLQGEALASALKSQLWDPSVDALCTFPDVLKKMATDLDNTQALGQNFKVDPAGVMDAVQNLRAQAQTMGQLTDNAQQKVVVNDSQIQIVPAQQDTVSVPDYDPTYLYGANYAPGWLTYGAGVMVGSAFYNNWGAFNWATHGMYMGASVRSNYYAGNYHYPGVNTWSRASSYSGGYRSYAPASSAIYQSPANRAGNNAGGYRGYAPQANAIYHSPSNMGAGYNAAGYRGYAPQANAIYHGPSPSTGAWAGGMESRAASRGYSSMGSFSGGGGMHFGGGRR